MNALLRPSLQTPCHCLCKIVAVMRSVLLAACVALVTMAALHARGAQSAVVAIDVTVVDRAGRPVTNLAAADLQVELDRRPGRVLTATYLPSDAPMAGSAGQQIAAPESGNYRLEFSLPLAPGPYTLGFAAADAAGPSAPLQRSCRRSWRRWDRSRQATCCAGRRRRAPNRGRCYSRSFPRMPTRLVRRWSCTGQRLRAEQPMSSSK